MCGTPAHTTADWASLNKRCFLLLLLLGFTGCSLPASASAELWQQLRLGGHVLLIRHAATDPGVGDPPHFDLNDCKTQRNLNAAGRSDARQLGKALNQLGIPVSTVRSSRWCRCLETARLAFNAAEPWPALDNTFETAERRPAQMREIEKLLAQPVSSGNIVLVTHGVNILALTGVSPSEGEIVAVRADGKGRHAVIGRGRPGR